MLNQEEKNASGGSPQKMPACATGRSIQLAQMEDLWAEGLMKKLLADYGGDFTFDYLGDSWRVTFSQQQVKVSAEAKRISKAIIKLYGKKECLTLKTTAV